MKRGWGGCEISDVLKPKRVKSTHAVKFRATEGRNWKTRSREPLGDCLMTQHSQQEGTSGAREGAGLWRQKVKVDFLTQKCVTWTCFPGGRGVEVGIN